MIPYDDLVMALANWRAKQGLPVVGLAGGATPSPAAPTPGPPTRATPPPAPSRGFIANVTPPPLAPLEAHEDVEDGSLIEEAHYENEGDDFAMAFNSIQQADPEDSATAIGVPPPVAPGGRDSFGGTTQPEPDPPTEDLPPPRRPHNDDW